MARKTLLNEQEIRKFLKLANISTVGEEKIQEMGGQHYNRNVDDDEEDGNKQEEALDMMPDDDEMAPEEDAMDLGADMEMDAELDDDPMGDLEGAEEMSLTDDEAQAIIDLADKLRGAMDDVPGDDEEMMDVEDEIAPVEDEMGLDDEEPIEMAEDQTAPKGGDSVLKGASEEDLVAEVSRRVAKRLKATQQKEAVVDQLAERILQRLTKK